jgi:hypothetical protein
MSTESEYVCHQLVAIDHVVERASPVQESRRHRALDDPVVTKDRAQRHDAGAAGEEQ